ncbi:hypothetical protein DWF00_05645 [Bosea caraganae]|uniref:Uncharacterized protein n=1 Tax=Bosea caraganae TaxID=2763117 RepID=A0A370L337_9HYPH|nr:hypothetical protein [Bosea caraganae]RDJ22852.1 hypothetical protein DWE98_16890 [Bosea caraganae]RDJ28631.1 hypothetical protein DWF00_05645 [Bosea caraganae]
MRRAIALIGLFGIIGAGLSLAVLPPSKTVAAPNANRTFLIPASDGYGVADCLSTKASECGKIVADAWCESQGFAKSVAFGTAAREDFTGTVTKQAQVDPAEQPLTITCGE